MDIEGLGPQVVELLINSGRIKDIADLYTLSSDDIAPLERMGKKSADNLVEAIAQTGVNDTISAKIKEYEEQKRFTRHIAFKLPDDHSARAFRMRQQFCG
jgi:DNA-directed RNA polymerase alpha subunit